MIGHVAGVGLAANLTELRKWFCPQKTTPSGGRYRQGTNQMATKPRAQVQKAHPLQAANSIWEEMRRRVADLFREQGVDPHDWNVQSMEPRGWCEGKRKVQS